MKAGVKMGQKLKTIVLRFRDLVTEEDATIKEHCEIIKDKGFVWWAWWKKGAEVTPTDEFASLSARANEEAVTIYLLDSGQKKLYKAVCEDIKSTKKAENPSPDNGHTPEYYRDKSYYAWFKFTSIEECNETELKNYTYLDSDPLFDDGETDYRLFFNKKVFSAAELIQQNRTVWFLREAEEGDKENEIILLNSNVVQPYIYNSKYHALSGDTFLWLSDLHFSNDVLSVKGTTNQVSLTQHIKQCVKKDFSDIAAVIISGDISDCCRKEGFEYAEEFISDLNRESGCKLDSDNIVICPGNHDLMRIESDIPAGSAPGLFSEDGNTYKFYRKFFKSIYNIDPDKFLSCGRKFVTSSGKTIEIAALNTVMLQQYKNFEGHGFITQEQLDHVEKAMCWDKNTDSSSYRIVVMHHHYCPACLSERIEVKKVSSVVYDADRLMRWLVKNNVKMLLHGHKHNKFLSKVSYPKENSNKNSKIDVDDMHSVYIVSAGGIGADGSEHTFATLAFKREYVDIIIYKIYTDNINPDECIETIKIPI